MEEFIKNGAVLLWIVAFAVISISMFIFSILQKKSDKGDRWFLASCLLFVPCSLFTALFCGLAFFEERWSLLGKRFIIYLFFLILAFACFVIGRYKSKKETEETEEEETEEEEIKEKAEEEAPEKKTEEDKIEKDEVEEETKEVEKEITEDKIEEKKDLVTEKTDVSQEKSEMKIAILMKQVPNTETKIEIKDESSGIKTENIEYVINPYDEYAIEEALKLQESIDGAKTVIISAGPERVTKAIKKALAMGVNDTIHIVDDNAFDSGDSLLTATALAKILEQESFDIIFTGKQAVDYDNSQVPQMVASLLNIPCVTNVSKFEFKDGKVFVTREIEGGTKEKIELTTPCVIGATKGLNKPRYETLKGMGRAKKKEIKKVSLADLEIDAAQIIKTEIVKYDLPPKKQTGKIVQSAEELAKALREEAKVI